MSPIPNVLRDCDFQAGQLLLVDKPQDWTSFDVVNKIRYRLKKLLGVKKIKVGHAGTLDPMATGLLLICTGKMTKQIDTYQGQAKTYLGTLTLGATTPSYDKETPIDATFPTEHLAPERLEAAREAFIGDLQQLPPVYSAIKVDGVPLYKKARKGIAVEVKPRPVQIYDFQLTRIALPDVDFTVHCSKGTYIRSLAYDFGKAVDSGAYLSRLCRTQIGEYRLEEAWNLADLIRGLEELGEAKP
ncbi:MAG: tRNA pseudouridine(55) synthase TruB [Bacteroidota bacterium]